MGAQARGLVPPFPFEADQPAEKAAGQRPASARKGNGGGQRQGGNKRGGGQPQNTGGGTFADLFAKAKDEQKKGKKRL